MVALIVAFGKNRVIGNKGCIPWKIKGEQSRFKTLTTGNVVVMGRRSYEEIGAPLPNRMTYVVSNTKSFDQEGVQTVASLEEALSLSKGKDIFISGGAMLYEQALPIAEKLYITEIDLEVEGDTYFPAFDESLYEKKIESEIAGEIPYQYITYIRRNL